MSIFERRLSFQMLYFMKNNQKIILQWSWGPGGTVVPFTMGLWQSPSGGSGGKAPSPFMPGELIIVWNKRNKAT